MHSARAMTAIAPNPALPQPPAPAADVAPAKPVAQHPSHGKAQRQIGRWVRWIAPLLAVGAIAAVGVKTLGARSATPVRYETAAIARGPIDAKVTATGAVSALVTVLVGSQVSGRIDAINVDFGSPVKKGQVIATIDPSLFRAAAEQARANHAVAIANLEKARAQQVEADKQFVRGQALSAEGVMSRADLDVAEANARVAKAQVTAAQAQAVQAKAALDQAELNLKYSTIVSPIDGVVISRNVDVGQTVAATLQAPTLFTIAQDLGQMQVDTNVAEADVGKIRAGMDVTFTVDAYPGHPFNGKVRQVRDAAQTVQNVVTYDAVIDFNNAEHLLKPGMTASVTFVYAHKADALRMPNGALRFRPDAATVAAMTAVKGGGAPAKIPAQTLAADERAVWLLREGRAVAETVRVGITDGSSTEIVSGGVHEGDAAIIEVVADAAATKRP
jgi:HlyD family secretion protein